MCFPPGVIEADMKQLNKPKKDSKRGANLHRAKKAKNDEFYTQLSDIETELAHYKDQFKDKIIYCNCDNPTMSNFIKYFNDNNDKLGFTQLLTSHYDPITKTGDFRSAESIALLKQADIVITNPPFSLFREYVAQLVEYKKQFLIVGSLNAVTYKEIFPLIKDDKVWLGYHNGSMTFDVPDTYTGKCI